MKSRSGMSHLCRVALMLLVLVVGSREAAAASLFSTNAEGTGPAGAIGPATETSSAPITITSEVTDASGFAYLDFSGTEPAFAKATQSYTSNGAVVAQGVWSDGNPHSLSATSTHTETFTNTSGGALDYEYEFFIIPAFLRIKDGVGIDETNPDAPYLGLAFEILVNGSSIFSASAELQGGAMGHLLTKSGVDLGGTYFRETPRGGLFGYSFDAHNDTLSLGTLGDGESLTLTWSISAFIWSSGNSVGASALIGDPANIAADPGFGGMISPASNVVIISSVPVPAPFGLTLFGLGLVAFTIRRRRR